MGKPAPMANRMFYVAILLVVVSSPTFHVQATTCDCRPDFNTEAEGNGWCSRTKEDAKWCKLKFNEESATASQQEFMNTMTQLAIKTVDVANATKILNTVPLSNWKIEFIDNYWLTLFSITLWDIAPDKLREIAVIIQKNRDRLFSMVTKDGGDFNSDGYRIDGSPGCLQFTKAAFSTMVRTAFAQKGRFPFTEEPKRSPFQQCARR